MTFEAGVNASSIFVLLISWLFVFGIKRIIAEHMGKVE